MTAVLADPAPILDYPPRRDGTPPGPNRAQAVAHTVEVDELLYGGAAGGGKTDYLIAEVLAVLLEFPGSGGAIFRRTLVQLEELGGIVNRLLDRIPTDVATYNANKRQFTFRNGSRLKLAYCASDRDVTNYQGAEWAIVAFDQLEQFTEFQYTYLLHRLRQSGAVAARMAEVGYRPKAISSANPGGVGHGWVKRRFIDPFPKGGIRFRPAPTADRPTPGVRCFIPATLADNEDNVDQGYRAQLEALTGDTRRAMLDGDWNVYAGQRFREFRTHIHVIDPEDLPIPLGLGVPRVCAVDYGLAAPFCALWIARLTDDLAVVYRELYGPGLTPTEQARAILAAEAPGERTRARPIPTALDPACWARSPNDTAPAPKPTVGRREPPPPPSSIAGRYLRAGLHVLKANNDRLAGVADVDDRLRVRADGFPRLLIYSTCRNLIRTLPELPRDDKRPEDVDTSAEDHAYDALRYGLALLGRQRPGTHHDAPRTPPGRPPAPRPGPPPERLRRPSATVTGSLRDLQL